MWYSFPGIRNVRGHKSLPYSPWFVGTRRFSGAEKWCEDLTHSNNHLLCTNIHYLLAFININVHIKPFINDSAPMPLMIFKIHFFHILFR